MYPRPLYRGGFQKSRRKKENGTLENAAEWKGDLPMTDTKKKDRPARRPDCVTEVRRGNTVLVVSGYFKQGTTATAADKMLKVLEAESAAGHKINYTM